MERPSLPRILAILFILSISSTAYAQKWAREMFKNLDHDFGTVAAGAKVQYAFEFTNPYIEDVHIQSVRISCSCTKITYPQEIIKTHEKKQIIATIDTLSFKGYKGATISVVLDKPFPAEVQLNVKTYIRQDVVFQPGEVQFGSVGAGEKISKKISIGYAGRSDWAIKSVTSPYTFLKTRLVEDVRAVGQVRYTLWVDLDPDSPVGYLDGHILLNTNDYDPKRAQVPLAVSGMIEPPIEVRPTFLTFLGNTGGEEIVRNLVVKGRAPFKILGIRSEDPRILATYNENVGKIHIVRVAFKPDHFVGKKTDKIMIETDLPNEPPLEVKILSETVDANTNGHTPATDVPAMEMPATDVPPVDAPPLVTPPAITPPLTPPSNAPSSDTPPASDSQNVEPVQPLNI